MDEVIRTENLVKYYGKTHAVDDISITVEKGEIYGFLGLNGAGKTTVIRMLLGMVKPTSGTAYLNNISIKPGIVDIWKQVGYLVETPYSYPDLTVMENLDVIRKLRGIVDRDVVNQIIDTLQLEQYKNIIAKHLSLGNAQRLGIAKALIHNPDILILDEPANGLDPAGIVEIRNLLTNLARNGVTIFISSHILGEISKFASRIGIIHQGKLVQEIKSSALQHHLTRRLIVNARDKSKLESVLKHEGYAPEFNINGYFEIANDEIIKAPDILATLLVKEQIPPTLLKVEEEDLESFFLRTVSLQEESI